jgi:hypothetical protein
MRTRYTVSFAALLLAAAFCGAYAASHAPASANARTAAAASTPADVTNVEPAAEPDPNMFQSPFPDRTCVGVPDTKCCTRQVFKQGNGTRQVAYTAPYNCDTGTTMQGTLRLRVTLITGNGACDQSAGFIPNNSVLEARGRVISRTDGFGDFNGDFTITNPAGVVLFSGCIETLDRVGTHRSCENCNPTSHYEGWMTGRGQGPLSSFSIRASIGARGLLPLPQTPSQATAVDINGVLLKCP